MVLRRFPTILEWDAEDRVWVTYVPSLNHLSTYGETESEALERTREAIAGYLEAAQKEGLSAFSDSPEPRIVDLQVATP
jgi:predicted RNase H-like HicB family nuclease